MFQTVTTGGTVPYLLLSYNASDKLRVVLPSERTLHMPLQILNDSFRIQGLLTEMGWTGLLAPATPGAGVQFQEVFPCELFNPSDAVGLCGIQIDFG
jgi:hypothetical protein